MSLQGIKLPLYYNSHRMFRLLRTHAECRSPAARLLATDTPSLRSPNWNIPRRSTGIVIDACRAACIPRHMLRSARTRRSPSRSHSLSCRESTLRPTPDGALAALRSDLPAHRLLLVIRGLSCTQGVVGEVVSGRPWCRNNRVPLGIEGAVDAGTPVSRILMPTWRRMVHEPFRRARSSCRPSESQA